MINFERFWADGNTPYEDDEEQDEVETDSEVPPGVTPAEIAEWEKRHGVTLPVLLRSALGQRNGGFVRNASVEILPLDQIVPVDDSFWEWTELEDDEAADHALMFVFGSEIETGASFLLNFNAQGSTGPPSVYLDHHGESTYLVQDTLEDLFETALASSDGPSVDWAEALAAADVLARESIDLSVMYRGKRAWEDQILAQGEEALVLFTRHQSPDGTILTRTTLPLPLDPDWATIEPYRPAPAGTFALQIQPEQSEGIIEVRSETNDEGRWMNSRQEGVPIYVQFESADRARLEALRTRLLGAEGSARAQASQDRQADLAATLDALPPEQRTAAMLQAALAMKDEADRQFAATYGRLGLGDLPPELANAAEAIQTRLQEMAEKARRHAEPNLPDPETLRRIMDSLRDPNAR